MRKGGEITPKAGVVGIALNSAEKGEPVEVLVVNPAGVDHRLIEYVFDRSTPPPPRERRDEEDPPYAGVMVHCCRDYLPRGGRLLKKLTETSWLVQVDESELVVHEPDEVWG